ncbi:MAG TPA: hypothetical protein VEC19_07545 [Usitatibacter sp.]|nr:hypothetical protein [Usitatibacter sp.]
MAIDSQARFVLGALDPEMREIARVLRREGRGILRATNEGALVLPRTAYEADGVVAHTAKGLERALVLPGEPLVMVECSLRGHEPLLRVDHHHPGDPGYEMPPERYVEGASIGQTLRLLDIEPNDTQRLLAAADHCLTAAYQGRCPGVDPDELLFMRASWRARMTGRGLADVVAGILDSAARVRRQHDSEAGESLFLDPTEIPPDLAEGAAYAGYPIRYRDLFPGGEIKEMLKGATPEHIERFMAEHRDAGREVYGNPWRGYAGAYIQ